MIGTLKGLTAMSPSKLTKYSCVFFCSGCFLINLLFFYGSFGVKAAYAEKEMYTIQLGAYQNVENAQKEMESLKMLGHNAFYVFEEAEGEIALYRVYIERFSRKEDAEKEAEVLSELNLISDYTIRVIGEPIQEDDEIIKPFPVFNKVEESDGGNGAPNNYYLHVCSLREEKNAIELTARLKNLGYDAVYQYETFDIGGWYRVYIEGYSSEKEALNRAEALQSSGIISYYKVMKKMEESVPDLELTGSNENVFFLHISSFKEESNAEDQVQTLGKQGYKVFSVEEMVAGEQWYRVYIGEFYSEDEARKEGSEIKDKGRVSYFKPIEIKADVLGK